MSKSLCKYLLPFLLIVPISAESYSIESLLDLVKDRSDDIEISEVEYQVSGEEVRMSRAEAYPQINFVTGVGYTGKSMEPQKYSTPPASPDNPTGYLSHIHGGTVNWGVTLAQPLITFGKVRSVLKIADIYQGQRSNTLAYKKEMYYFNVIQQFSTTYIAQEKVDIASKIVEHDKRYLDKTRAEFELGTALPHDTLNVVAKLSKSESDLIRAKAEFSVAIQKLSNLTEIPMDNSTTLEYNSAGWLSGLNLANDETGLQLILKAAEVAMVKEQIKYERSKLFPSIDLQAGLNNSYMIPNSSRAEKGIKDKIPAGNEDAVNETISYMENNSPDFSDYFNPDFFNYSIGVQLTWNIFDGNRMRANFHKTRYNYEKTLLEEKKLKEENALLIDESKKLYTAVEESQVAAVAQRDALERAFESIQEDYRDGYTEFLTFSDMQQNIASAYLSISTLNMQKVLVAAQYRIASGISIVKEVK